MNNGTRTNSAKRGTRKRSESRERGETRKNGFGACKDGDMYENCLPNQEPDQLKRAEIATDRQPDQLKRAEIATDRCDRKISL